MRAYIAIFACAACTGGPGSGSGSPTPRTSTLDQAVETGEPAPAPNVVENIIYDDSHTDMIVNGSFEDYADPNVPAGWTVDEIYGWRGMYAPTEGWRGGAVRFVRNAQGRHFLAQDVQVEPNHRYTVQMVFHVVATDSRRGGLYVVEPG